MYKVHFYKKAAVTFNDNNCWHLSMFQIFERITHDLHWYQNDFCFWVILLIISIHPSILISILTNDNYSCMKPTFSYVRRFGKAVLAFEFVFFFFNWNFNLFWAVQLIFSKSFLTKIMVFSFNFIDASSNSYLMIIGETIQNRYMYIYAHISLKRSYSIRIKFESIICLSAIDEKRTQ